MLKEISLNPAKTLSGAFQDLNYEKLEIPISVTAPHNPNEKQVPPTQNSLISFTVSHQLLNSTVSLAFSYYYGQTQLIVSVFGPSESKMGSKQDPAKGFIELSVKDTTASPKQTDSMK